MKKIFLALFMLSSMVMASKGEAELGGSFRVSKEPEFAFVEFNVESLCYATPAEAMEANNTAASKIQEILEVYVDEDSAIDDVQTNGGIASDYSKTIYGGEHSTMVCQNTFQQSTKIIWKTDDIAGFSEAFARVKGEVNGQFVRADKEDGAVPLTFVNISRPERDVCEKTKEAMRLEAQAGAVANAKSRFFASVGQGCIKAKIVKITDQVESYSSSPSYAARELSGAAPGGDRSVRISFEEITVSSSVMVAFRFKKIKIRNDFAIMHIQE